MSKNNSGSIPQCSHGRVDIINCEYCLKERLLIAAEVQPLVDEFWEHRGRRDLADLFLLAYKMGMKKASA